MSFRAQRSRDYRDILRRFFAALGMTAGKSATYDGGEYIKETEKILEESVLFLTDKKGDNSMYNAKIERISEILCLLLHLMGGESFSKTKVVKLLYLLDVVKSRKGKPKFSGITFKSYYYGPYSDEIKESLSLLSSLGYVTIKEYIGFNGNSYHHIQLNRVADFGHLTDREKVEIKQIVSPLINRSLNELLDITYSTKEFEKTSFGEVISL